jgi:hypothetical protein
MTRFDELFELGREAVLSGVQECDKQPGDGGRWGIAVILKPDATLTTSLRSLAGGDAGRREHHWPTGSPGAVQFAGPIDDPQRLVTWIAVRRETFVAQASFETAQLVRYIFNGRHTELATLASVVLKPLLQGVADQLGPVVQLQLPQGVLHMILHCPM